jgi:hypothetical protein
MQKLLEKGGKAITDYSNGIASNLIVTEKAAEASKNYYTSINRLNEAMTGLKVGFGNDFIPLLANAADGLMNIKNVMDSTAPSFMGYLAWIKLYKLLTGENTSSTNALAIAQNDLTSGIINGNQAWAQAYAQLSLAREGTGSLTDATFAEAAAAYKSGAVLTQEQAILLGLSGQTLTSTADIKKFAASLNALKSKVLFVTTYTQTIALTGSWLDAIAQEKMKWRSAKLAALDEGTYLNENPAPAPGATTPTGGYWRTKKNGKRQWVSYATGANFTVPAGYEGDNYPITVKTGEKVKISPAGQTDNDMAMVISKLDKLPSAIAKAVRDGVLRAAGGAA